MKTRHEQVSACSIEVMSSMLQNKLLDSAGAAGERHGSNYGGSQLLGCNQADSNMMCLCIQLPDVGGQPAHSRRSKILKLSCADCQCVIIGDPRRIGSGCTRAQAMQKWNVARARACHEMPMFQICHHWQAGDLVKKIQLGSRVSECRHVDPSLTLPMV
jgi:hypothetical protein